MPVLRASRDHRRRQRKLRQLSRGRHLTTRRRGGCRSERITASPRETCWVCAKLAEKILIFVNNDMRFAEDFVERLADPLIADPSLFATDARQRDWGDSIDLHLRTTIKRVPLLRSVGAGRGPLPGLELKQEESLQRVIAFQPCAGNMAVRRWMFDALGGLDRRMKAGWEDTDLALKAWLRGWPTVFVPEAVCWHLVGVASSSQRGRLVRRQGEIEGRLILAVRHLPIEAVCATFLATLYAFARDRLRGAPVARPEGSAILGTRRWFLSVASERRRQYRYAGVRPRQQLDRLEHHLSTSERPPSSTEEGGP